MGQPGQRRVPETSGRGAARPRPGRSDGRRRSDQALPAAGWRRAGVGLSVGLLAALGLWVAPAAALMPPSVYENARDTATSVVVLEVTRVSPPAAGFGECRVDGVVRQLERGTAFVPGSAVTLKVPCAKPGAQPPLGGTIYQQLESLEAAPYGRAWLDAAGQVVLSQYQQLQHLP